jgi:hypothetical protein
MDLHLNSPIRHHIAFTFTCTSSDYVQVRHSVVAVRGQFVSSSSAHRITANQLLHTTKLLHHQHAMLWPETTVQGVQNK